MAWDDTARQVGTKSIGQVESSMNYGAVNPTDPITVGLFQWYGTRAATILNRMKNENPSAWTGIPSSLNSDLSAHSETSSFWDSRHVTQTEINALRPVLRANTTIQNSQAAKDLDEYKDVAVAQGMDADANTDAVNFFCNMYNQGPRYALRVLANAGPDSSLARLYSYCLNDSVLGIYKSRYQQAYDIIRTHDTSGVDGTGGGSTTPPPPDPTPGNPSPGQPSGDLAHIRMVGDTLSIRYKKGHSLFAVPTGTGMWIPRADTTVGSTPPPPPVDPTPPTPPADGTGVQGAMRSWLIDHQDAYAYSQGASRLSPDTNHYTDCSGLMYWVYKTVAHVNVGTWTGDQIGHGTLITTSANEAKAETKLAVGDLVFYRWHSSSPSSYDHVAMYIGNNEIESHGGPDTGPDRQSHSGEIDYALSGGGSIMVRRYV